MPCEDIAISIRNLTKTYRLFGHPGDRVKQFLSLGLKHYHREFTALQDVTFDIKKGETVGIIGRNGSGKSTLLQLISGILKPTSGTITASGRVSALLELGAGFNPEFTGRENIYFQGAIMGLTKEEIDHRFDDIAAFADIGEYMEQPVRTYSSGMTVRLAFASSINVDPDIFIVDEALAVGDAAFQFKCISRMKALADSGITLLFVSHDMGMVKTFCSQALYLDRGTKKSLGPADTVAEQYFLDIREEQQRRTQASDNLVVQKKPIEGSAKGIAFGTDKGHITTAYFAPSGQTNLSIHDTAKVRIYVAAEYAKSLAAPYLSVFLQDHRLIEISGKSFPLRETTVKQELSCAALEMEFDACLKPGTYFISLRLENREVDGSIFPLDKQTGVLSLVVSSQSKKFWGLVDLGIHETNKNWKELS